jgi:hypothetical protein
MDYEIPFGRQNLSVHATAPLVQKQLLHPSLEGK